MNSLMSVHARNVAEHATVAAPPGVATPGVGLPISVRNVLPIQRRGSISPPAEHLPDGRQQVRGRAALRHDTGSTGLQELAGRRRLVVDPQDDDAESRVTALQLPRNLR